MKLFDNVESHKTQICGIGHFEKELSILDPWCWNTSWCNNLGVMIKEGNQASLQDRTKTLIFLRHHLHEGLKKSFWWKITSLIQLDLNHSLKWMQYRPKFVDINKDEDMVVEEIPDTMVLLVIIHQILRKWKPYGTTRSGTILRQNKKMGSVYKINLLRTMRIIVTDVV